MAMFKNESPIIKYEQLKDLVDTEVIEVSYAKSKNTNKQTTYYQYINNK